MRNIVYLLGAGASAQALPLVNDFNTRLNIFKYFLEEASKYNPDDNNSFLVKGLEQLIIDESNHYSIDTLAKKYWLTNQIDSYNKVKALMVCFFVYESFRKSEDIQGGNYPILTNIETKYRGTKYFESFNSSNKAIDLRYDALLASVINNKEEVNIPDNIKFLYLGIMMIS